MSTAPAAAPAAAAPGHPAPKAASPGATRLPAGAVIGLLVLLLAVASIHGTATGAYRIAPLDVVRILLGQLWYSLPAIDPLQGRWAALLTVDPQQVSVLMTIRLPRVVLAMATGAGLAVAGALMQGLFRNPLADPTLIGVSMGGALAAAFVIVLGATWLPGASRVFGTWTLPLAAFAGSLAATAIVYRVGAADGVPSLSMMLLAGIAINAAAGAGIGLLTFLADDEQLRTLAFWNLGSLGGASWQTLAAVLPMVSIGLAIAFTLGRSLNALALGETRAGHLGVEVSRIKRIAVVLTALITGSLVAITGVIGFIGLVAPHVIRLVCGPDNRIVLPGAALLGAILVLAADAVARTAVAPAELPLGVLTALIGAPFFLLLLLRFRMHAAPGGL